MPRMNAALALFLLSALLPSPAFAGPLPGTASFSGSGQEGSASLAKVVLLVRHGVRSPVQPPSQREGWSERPWPRWSVPPGQLTPRGGELLRAEGTVLRQGLAFSGLLPRTGCPPAGAVFSGADGSERTEASARAMLEGLAPGCGCAVTVLPEGLFRPVRSGLMPPPRPDAARKQELALSMGKALHDVHPELLELAALLGPADDPRCTPSRSPCTPDSIPSFLLFPRARERQAITLEGSAERLASFAEILFLESLEWPAKAGAIPVAQAITTQDGGKSAVAGKTLDILNAPRGDSPDSLPLPPLSSLEEAPAPQSGLLLVAPQTALRLLNAHTAIRNTLQRFPEQAEAEGLPLLMLIADLLSGTSALPDANRARLALLCGHDTDIASVAALLGLHWEAPPFPPDCIPPGAMLMFRLWQTEQGRVVDAAFLCQSPAALFSEDWEAMAQASLTRVPLLLPEAALSTPTGTGVRLEEFLRNAASKVGTGLHDKLDRLLAAPSS